MVLAGGVGTRLWPESRQSKPKQLLALVGQRTMLQETVDRVLPLAEPSDVFVVTARPYTRAVCQQLPDVPKVNVLGEPMGRGSGPAIGLAATYLDCRRRRRGGLSAGRPLHRRPGPVPPGAASPPSRWRRQGYLVTLGIKPSGALHRLRLHRAGRVAGRPSTGSPPISVARFTEKPDRATAAGFIASGRFTWNAGMFVGSTRTFLDEIAAYLPDLAGKLATIQAALRHAEGARGAERGLADGRRR